MTKQDWILVAQSLLVMGQLLLAGLVATQRLLRSRNPALISPFERSYTSVTALLTTLLMVANAATTFVNTSDNVWIRVIGIATPVMFLVHFGGVILIHAAAARKNEKLNGERASR